ncbi:MAG: DUF305 domain-containing protein [Alphaproteobacteria bacterium]
MRILLMILFFTIITSPAHAVVETSYTHHKDRISTPWYIANNAQTKAADLAFIKHMRPHHAGALSMSEAYLTDPAAQNVRLKQLARGIIHNQTFEIAVMDMIEDYQKRSKADGSIEQVAEKDMVQKLVFWRAPLPSVLDRSYGDQGVSQSDVAFAKAMIIHHEGALVMAQGYLDKAADNGYLERLCLDILVDQANEIAYMHSIIDEYAGDPDDVVITADMIHGMEGMEHMLPGHEDNHSAHHMH